MARGASTSVDGILYGEETLSPRVPTLPAEFSLASRTYFVRQLAEAEQLKQELDELSMQLAGSVDAAGSLAQAKVAVADICDDRTFRVLMSECYQDMVDKRDYYHRSLDTFTDEDRAGQRDLRLEKIKERDKMIAAIDAAGEDAYRQQQEQRLEQELATADRLVDDVRRAAALLLR